MTADEVRAFAERHLEHWKQLDVDAITDDHTSDGVVDSPSAGTHRGHEAIRRNLLKWTTSFPDLQFDREQIVADVDAAVIVFWMRGTQQSEFFGVPAAGQHLEMHLVLILNFADGKIAHEQRIYDFSGVMAKLGVFRIKPT